MKCFTGTTPGINTREGKILVGESGRGRELVTVPLPPGAIFGQPDLLTECTGDATAVVVFLKDQSGFRGGWSLRDARTAEEWDIIVSNPQSDDRPGERSHRALVIAEGYCAQGMAGRMGGGSEYLLVLRHGQAVECVRGGRLYGAPSVIRLECVAGTIVSSDPRAEAEERKAASKWSALTEVSGGAEPTETELSWGGGSVRNRDHNWVCRPHLKDADGKVYVFQGTAIPGIVEVLEDTSVTSGYQSGCCQRFRVALAKGVTFLGDRIPGEVEAGEVATEESQKFGTNLGDLLKNAGA